MTKAEVWALRLFVLGVTLTSTLNLIKSCAKTETKPLSFLSEKRIPTGLLSFYKGKFEPDSITIKSPADSDFIHVPVWWVKHVEEKLVKP